LNRADRRCSGFCSIEGLQYAFEHCFGSYKACGVYHELLAERQARRGQPVAGSPGGGSDSMRFLWTTACTSPEAAGHVKPAAARPSRAPSAQFVQVRLPSIAASAAVAVALLDCAVSSATAAQ
jgi:hypothetical protein